MEYTNDLRPFIKQDAIADISDQKPNEKFFTMHLHPKDDYYDMSQHRDALSKLGVRYQFLGNGYGYNRMYSMYGSQDALKNAYTKYFKLPESKFEKVFNNGEELYDFVKRFKGGNW